MERKVKYNYDFKLRCVIFDQKMKKTVTFLILLFIFKLCYSQNSNEYVKIERVLFIF